MLLEKWEGICLWLFRVYKDIYRKGFKNMSNMIMCVDLKDYFGFYIERKGEGVEGWVKRWWYIEIDCVNEVNCWFFCYIK